MKNWALTGLILATLLSAVLHATGAITGAVRSVRGRDVRADVAPVRFSLQKVYEGGEAVAGVPPATPSQTGAVVDSTVYDFQGYGTLPRRVVAIGASALHLIAYVSPDEALLDQGLTYVYYHGAFADFGRIGNGFGGLSGYDGSPGLGNVAVISTTWRGFDSTATWMSFQDAFQGLGAFSGASVDTGPVLDECDQVFYPGIYVDNNAGEAMAMCGMTLQPCSGGFADILVTHAPDSGFFWPEGTILQTLDDPTKWNAGPDWPIMDGADGGCVGIVSTDFGTNVYLWDSSDNGVTWGDRQSVTGFETGPQKVAPDSNTGRCGKGSRAICRSLGRAR
jgi:hypothetical protein